MEMVKVEGVEEKREEGEAEAEEMEGKEGGPLQVKYFQKAQMGQVLPQQN